MGSEVGFWPGVEAGDAYVPRCMQGFEWQIYVGVEWNLPRLHVARLTAWVLDLTSRQENATQGGP